MNYIEVNISTLDQDIKSMEEKMKLIRSDMKAMFDSVTALDSMWDGPANAAFVRQFSIDKNIFDEVCNAVDGVTDSMNNAKDEYRKCESRVSEIVNQIRI